MYKLMPMPGLEPKLQVRDDTPMRIGALEFGIMSPEDIELQAETLEISDRNLYDLSPPGPTQFGPLDKRLGPQKGEFCEVCREEQKSCNGHWGYIALELPCFHVGFLGFTLEILNSICKSCSRILLPEDRRRHYMSSVHRYKTDTFLRKGTIKAIRAECSKIKICTRCGASNGPVRKVAGHTCKIIHLHFDAFEKSTAKKKVPPRDKVILDLRTQAWKRGQEGSERLLSKLMDDMPAYKVHRIFSRIPDIDCELLGIDSSRGRPESYLWTYLPVPPTNIRPSVPGDQGTTEDDLTTKLSEIVEINTRLRAAIETSERVENWMELYEKLQDYIAMYINSNAPGLNKTEYGKAIRSFCSRLKGKQGRFRGNLSGKRVNFSGRTVIGPDPNLSVEQVGVPQHIAKILTYPEKVTPHNLQRLREAVMNGPDKWPGANQVTKVKGHIIKLGIVKAFRGNDRLIQEANKLDIGDTVDRHLIDGDIVLFNRQPSLHKLSILSHLVKVLPGRTLRLNESVCNPYNADFDGDEMNIHVPQTEEARIEARELMGVKHNLVTPKNGAPIIAPIQDFITGAYLLSLKDTFFDRGQFSQLMCQMFDADGFDNPETGRRENYYIPPPAIMKPKRLWTGKQLLSVLLQPSRQSKIKINLDGPCKGYKKDKDAPYPGAPRDLFPDDQWLVVRNSEILAGRLDKTIIGDGRKSTLFYALLREYGSDHAVKGMNRLAKLCARFLGKQGFSIGLGDVTPTAVFNEAKQQLVDEAVRKAHNIIVQFTKGTLARDPGCDAEQTMENKVSQILSSIRDEIGNRALELLSPYNAAVIMAKSGSKGSNVNVSQMVGMVGQQVIGGKRVVNGFQDRTLPHFRKGSREPAAKGFISNSFHSGLHPTEFIFHAMSGREGLVDTAVKTAETGYMSRRLIKSLEDAHIVYDQTVRDSFGGILEFAFGDDNLDPAELEGQGKPVNFDRTWLQSVSSTHNPDDVGLTPAEIQELTEKLLREQDKHYRELSFEEMLAGASEANAGPEAYNSSRHFLQDMLKYIVNKAQGLHKLYQQYMVYSDARYDGATASTPADQKIFEKFAQVSAGIDPAKNRASVDKILKVTKRNLETFIKACFVKYEKAKVQPGHAVGAIAAQSIGEPGTQMTLKTFHFAGVAGMSITQGVPRIKEIINAAKKISTPIVTVRLENAYSAQVAQIVKARIEKTYLRDIAEYVAENWTPTGGYITIKFDLETMQRLQLDLNMREIALAILRHRGLKLKPENIQLYGTRHIRITPPEPAVSKADLDYKRVLDDETGGDVVRRVSARRKKPTDEYHIIQDLMRSVLDVVVAGYPEANRVVIKKIDAAERESKRKKKTGKPKQDKFYLYVEGYGLKKVMNTEGVNGLKTRTNSVLEVFETLGIEAAKSVIISEIKEVMGSMDIDNHHIQLLATTMTRFGEITGITRFGLAKTRDSVLQLASFEKTPDHLFEAASGMKTDRIQGVSENIIMGQPVKLGTGLANVVMPLKLDTNFVQRRDPFLSVGRSGVNVSQGQGQAFRIGERVRSVH
ncbi:uncharacterized protein PV09_00821 [Verruconis gallopava]|uniref:DNA-directed RNA polymerase subunit n=1 Tax=Verruconis gallopava TaxID=253628 RepID=A0A0D1Y1F0_9PEZI|nr:uncharacterized protein PV09_00821 [Verruconis gallopava]KIW08901.1 hypothetical protein PV09_00821 [Verruconis gallopava]